MQKKKWRLVLKENDEIHGEEGERRRLNLLAGREISNFSSRKDFAHSFPPFFPLVFF